MGVDGGVVVEKEADEIGTADPNGVVKGSGADVVAGVDVGSGGYEGARGFEIAGADGFAQLCVVCLKEEAS